MADSRKEVTQQHIDNMSIIMAINGDVPLFPDWSRTEGNSSMRYGVLGQIRSTYLGRSVCVRAGAPDARQSLGNNHPNFIHEGNRGYPSAVWATIPTPDTVDWKFIKKEYQVESTNDMKITDGEHGE